MRNRREDGVKRRNTTGVRVARRSRGSKTSCPRNPARGVVLGTGVDLVESVRMARMLKKWGRTFKDRVFLPGEQAYCEASAVPVQHYAGRFAVKEAVSKAFGTGFGPHLGLLDIEVERNAETGAPSVRLSARGRALAGRKGVGAILVSLAHTRQYAMAQAILLGEGT
jgi:holo-[acyl-carrier protein] synthase